MSLEVLRSNPGIDPTAQNELAKELQRAGRDGFEMLRWTGFPDDYEQLKYACELIWHFFVGKRRVGGGVVSGSQLALKLNRLAKAKSVKALIVRELADQDSPDADRAVEDVLDFVRTWAGFHFPRYLMALHRVQEAVYRERYGTAGDYSAYASSVENMFSTSGLVALDEYGVPLQIAEKMRPHFGEHETVDQALQQLRRIDVRRVLSLTDFERELVRDAQAGLGAEVGASAGTED